VHIGVCGQKCGREIHRFLMHEVHARETARLNPKGVQF
jgi:hypothetical protein